MNNKRINSLFIIFIFLFISVYTFAQDEQNWTSHISYSADISTIAQNGDNIYALTDGKLFIYNQSDKSLEEYIKNKENSDITHIAYNKRQKCLLVTRSDANIELVYEDKSYTNIPYLKDYLAQNIDKTINQIFMTGDSAYLATNYGFSIIDLSEKVIKESGIFNTKFYSICLLENKLYAATENGIRVAEINSNILDSKNWKEFAVSDHYKESDYKFNDEDIRSIINFKDKLHFLYPDSAIYVMETPESVKGI